MKKLFILVMVMVLATGFSFAGITWTGGANVVYSFGVSPFTYNSKVEIDSTWLSASGSATGTGFYVNFRGFGSGAPYVNQAYVYKTLGPVTLNIGKKAYMDFTLPMADNSPLWGYWGDTFIYHTYNLGATVGLDMLSASVMTNVASPLSVSLLANASFDPVSVSIFAEDNFKHISGRAAVSIDPVTFGVAGGYNIDTATMTALAVGASAGFGDFSVVADADLKDFSAIGITGQIGYTVNDVLTVYADGHYNIGSGDYFVDLWAEYSLMSGVTLIPTLSYDGIFDGDLTVEIRF